MPALCSLCLYGEDTFQELVASSVFFPELEELTVSEVALKDITRFLTSFPSRRSLTTINILTLDDSPRSEIGSFIRVLCNHCNPDTHRRFWLCLGRNDLDEDLEDDSSLFRHAVSLVHCGRALELVSTGPNWSTLTMRSLIPLAMFCHDLRAIALPGLRSWDDLVPRPAAIQRPSGHSFPRLRINLGLVLEGAESRIEAALRVLFPNMYAFGDSRQIRVGTQWLTAASKATGSHMPVHKALKSPDILLYIIEVLCPSKPSFTSHYDHYNAYDSTGGRSALAAFARTARIFLDPCLDAIWRHQFSLSPLLNCLDDSSNETAEPGMLRNPEYFTKNPDGLNWDRFDCYAHRVRSLWMDNEDGIPMTVFFVLATTHGTPLLPLLQHLMWRHTDQARLPYINLFCGPALRRLSIFQCTEAGPDDSAEKDQSIIATLISSLRDRSPSLHTVEFVLDEGDDFSNADVYHEASWIVLAMPPVTSFRCATPLSSRALTRLSSMRGLRSINLTGNETVGASRNPQLFFPDLEELSIRDIELKYATDFLASFPFRHSFKTINISTLDYTQGSAIEPFITALCKQCNPETLTRLCLQLDSWTCQHHEDDADLPAASSDVLTGLRDFTQLRELSIQSCAIQWEDQFLKDVVPAWRWLTALELDSGCAKWSNLTMQCLIPLAVNCPDLRSIILDLHNWDDPDPMLMMSQRSRTGCSPPRLYVHLNGVPAKAERRVAVALKAIFPNIYASWNRRVEFWIRHDWPGYQTITEEDYSTCRPRHDLDGAATLKFKSRLPSKTYREEEDGPRETYHYFERDPTGGRGAVAALAQTCRFLLEPCLDALWRHLFSLSPLLNCLDDTCVPLLEGEHGPRFCPGALRNPDRFGDLNNLNWDRFNYYARRVKSCWTDDDDGIPNPVWFGLAASRRAPLLSRLQHLIWRGSDQSKLPYLYLLCSPALQRLTVCLGLVGTGEPENDKSAMVNLVSSLSLRSPSLEEVEIIIDNDYDVDELCPTASWMVVTMHPLRSFSSASSIDLQALTWLSSMPALHSIHLTGSSAIRDLVASPVFFPELKEVIVSEVDLVDMTHFLTSFRTRHSFTTISISTLEDPSDGEIESFISTLCRYCNPDTLTCLRLNLVSESMWYDDDEPTLEYRIFIALRQFAQLREFSIKARGIRWEDQFLKDMAPAWRSLRIFNVDTAHKLELEQPLPKFTLRSLIPLATFCPDLHSIALEICNWDDPDPVLMAIQRPRKEHASLPELHVRLGHDLDAPPKNLRAERRIAAVLKALFPNVHSAWSTGVEFWIRHDWPEYKNLTPEGYSILSAERNRLR
ncbi:hypothetical protein EVG20_g7992 [Dentipellis fragilis]|uniref:F-box domain-containing protein n=1 Tax=Dentipellis fragilis TaxID=205917 RepID=A0A4Y9YBB5_9AGAM|nr:hypothetical protein EVG20_g7992 [Dentipellis fragilis]